MRTERATPWGFNDDDDPRLGVRRAAAQAQTEADREEPAADEDARDDDWDDWGLPVRSQSQEVASGASRR